MMQEHSVSIVIPVMDETHSLQTTVDIVMRENDPWIRELIFAVHPKRTTAESLQVLEGLKQSYPGYCVIHAQKKPFAGGALSEAFELVQGAYAILMASDLETNPATVKDMIARMRQDEASVDIIATSRWIQKGGFEGYQPLKWLLNFIFQGLMRRLFSTSLTDMTFGFRLYKTEILQRIVWEELKHPFFLETIVKPLRLGYRVIEIPTTWKARTEGMSQNTFFRNFDYLRMAWQVRWRPPESFLRPSSGPFPPQS